MRKEIIDGEINEKAIKFTLKIKDWFTWNVQTNNEKGSAGGNIKMNFPIQSSLVVAFICLAISILCATTPIVKWLVPVIMFSFAVYHFMKWYRALQLTKHVETWYEQSEIHTFAQKKLYRANSGYYLAGVCAGLSAYSGINVWVIRAAFIFFTFFILSGPIAYLLIWFFVSQKTDAAAAEQTPAE
jgi:phage shock protein PspC (stress-responsive transcriptional regulator)